MLAKIKNKKFLIVALVVFVALSFYWHQASALRANDGAVYGDLQAAAAQNKDLGSGGSPCKLLKFQAGACMVRIIGWIGYAVLWGVSWLLWLVGKIFNIVLSVQNNAFQNQAIVNIGWEITRNVANFFYIFLLLIISLGIILGLESYGSKQLLVRIVISALLVNFSLPLAGIVIDISNVLGNTFYIHMGGAGTDKDCPLNVGECRDISTALVAGFQPQKLLEGTTDPNGLGQIIDQQLDVVIGEFMGIVLILILSFVLFLATGMLLVRIVTLWILLILSPLAFLFWVLPDTKSYFSMWGKRLISESFFYPAFMFMLYLVLTMIQKGVMGGLFRGVTDNTGGGTTAWVTGKATFILGYLALAVMTYAALIVARSMASHSASVGEKFGKAGAKWARGYAGRVSNKYVASPIAQKALESKAWQQVSKIPILGHQMLRPLAASVQKDARDRQEIASRQAARMKNMAPREAATMLRSMSAGAQAQAWKGLGEKQQNKVLEHFASTEERVRLARSMQSTDRTGKEKYERSVAVASGNIADAMTILKHDPHDQTEIDNFLGDLNDSQLKGFMTAKAIESNVNIQEHIINKFGINEVGKVADSAETARAIGNVLSEARSSGKLERQNKALFDKITKAPGGIMLSSRLQKGERLTRFSYGEKLEKARPDKPPQNDGGGSTKKE